MRLSKLIKGVNFIGVINSQPVVIFPNDKLMIGYKNLMTFTKYRLFHGMITRTHTQARWLEQSSISLN